MDTEEAVSNWVAAWTSAWPRRDAEPIAALYADDAPYRALAFRERDDASGYLLREFAEETDIECRFGEPVVSGRRAAVEWWASWLEEGELITLAGATLLRFDDDGKVVDHRDYWNQAPGRIHPYPGW
jgi:nuclear transport factor 2 (NTF2) superfamily protein